MYVALCTRLGIPYTYCYALASFVLVLPMIYRDILNTYIIWFAFGWEGKIHNWEIHLTISKLPLINHVLLSGVEFCQHIIVKHLVLTLWRWECHRRLDQIVIFRFHCHKLTVQRHRRRLNPHDLRAFVSLIYVISRTNNIWAGFPRCVIRVCQQ